VCPSRSLSLIPSTRAASWGGSILVPRTTGYPVWLENWGEVCGCGVREGGVAGSVRAAAGRGELLLLWVAVESQVDVMLLLV
jgi:hypothetical protein